MHRKLTEPIALGLILTVGFLLATVILVLPKWNDIWDLKLNELGDFLAGISSTLAFIWIIVAVLLQRDELQAQREELRQSREALSLQAGELKRTADQQTMQVDIMTEQLKAAVLERRSKEAADHVRRLCGDIVGIIRTLCKPPGVSVTYPNGSTQIFAYPADSIAASYTASSFASALTALLQYLTADVAKLRGGGKISRKYLVEIVRLNKICTTTLLSTDETDLMNLVDPSIARLVEGIRDKTADLQRMVSTS